MSRTSGQYENAKRKAEELAKRLFQEKPEETKQALEEETTLGSPENLIDRNDDEDEQKNN